MKLALFSTIFLRNAYAHLNFLLTDIFDFEPNCFWLYPSENIMQSRLNSSKSSSESFFVLWKFSRKWNEQVKLWKQRLRYRIVRNEKIFLTGKKSFCKKAGEIFLSAKKKLYAVENI